jgi:hypothetical protein
MPLGNFSRAYLEQTAANNINTALQALANLASLNARMNAELAAQTLDTPAFYGEDPADPAGHPADPTDKANIVGALNESAAIYAWLNGNGQVAAPSGDPLAYGKFLLG